ncbi:MucR family transcriptional regulator [Altererythrobacter arenosus]|uniref:MucR family transcriptional regulator n=1 Tax=Altererythrobacter arenosus TaxID=3032592 RepID=A0ABY8FMC5_9SPHN|nr:MucR family transcriptional regulator [Altererythrobacter sp. CAU 1644]WFL76170.1 MucR family transcriptional regulator [Altererythrobacter sp. CAU 1644]
MVEDEAKENETLIILTSEIVSAHVGHNRVAVEALPGFIAGVFGALSSLGKGSDAQEPRPDPAVSIRSSVKQDHLVCLDCGRKMKMLKRHIRGDHGLSPDEYRERWELPANYPMTAPSYAATRSDLAKKLGLGTKANQNRGRKKKSR